MNRIYILKQLFKYLFLLLFMMAGVLIVEAQRSVSGTVIAADNEEPLPGANVIVKATTRGTITDINGNFQLELQENDQVIVISFIGYEEKEITIDQRMVYSVILELEQSALDEIVVIGYGTVRKSDLTGSVGSIKAEDITKITAINPEQSLQGKVTGVQVTSNSGAPGAGTVVRIRGVGTFNNSSPIYVVDGVILNDISFLNSGDIASMEVLKDASATAIYGSRGANGVIIITTKTGKAGQKSTFNYNSEIGFQHVAKKIDLLNGREFAIISNEIVPGSYNNIDIVPNTDWQDLIFNVAPMQNHQLSVTGATEKSTYYISMGLFNQNGIIDKSNYSRISFKLNNTYNLTRNLKFGNNITATPFRQQNAPNVTYAAYRAQPVLEPYFPDGTYAGVYNVGNPLASLEYSNDYRKGIRGVGNIYLQASILEDFSLKSSFGIDASYTKSENFTPAYQIYYPDGTLSQQENLYSDLSKENTENLNWLWENTLNYNKTVEKHAIDVVTGYTMQKASSEYMKMRGENILRDGSDFWYVNPSYILDETNNINTIQDIGNNVDANLYYSMISYLFRINYTFDNKYILTATFRRDGSSKFSKENRFSNFPSFAAGWNIGREDFMLGVPLVSKLKLRASWGIIGNEKIAYYDRYARVQSDILAVFGNPDFSLPAASYGKSGNPDLKWESTKQTDIGIEIGILEDKLVGEFDFYKRVTDDILIELSTPGYLGNGLYQKIRYNAAEVLNRGFEFMLTWRETINDFSYRIGILGSTIHNEVLNIGGSSGVDTVLIGGYLNNGQPVTLSRVGLPIGAFYGYQTDGVFQSIDELNAYPHSNQAGIGDLRFVDVNKDGIINGKDRTYIGSPIPTFIYGFNFGADYKGFDFSCDFQGQTGNEIFNGKEVVRPDPYNFEQRVFDRWTEGNPSNTEPKPSFGGYNYSPSDHFIQNASFLRLRSISLGYTLPSTISNKINMQLVRVYVKGTNLFTITKYTGYTPEIGTTNTGNGGDVLSNGIDNGIYPITSIYSFGINVTF